MSHTGYFQTKAHLQISGAALISGAITIISNWWKLRRALAIGAGHVRLE